jgi:peroxiredoxin
MTMLNRVSILLTAALFTLALWCGCSQQPGPEKPATAPAPGEVAKTKAEPETTPAGKSLLKHRKKKSQKVEETETEPEKSTEAQPAVIPKVVMSAADVATCLVKVGDALPAAKLPDLAGKQQSLRSLAGKKLTVVLFWTAGNAASQRALEDLKSDVLGPYEKDGVKVVAVIEGNTPEQAKAAAKEAAVTCPVLVDRDGAFFVKLAKGRLPRIYVLDPAGKILWFDIVYEQTTHDDLVQTIKAVLGK